MKNLRTARRMQRGDRLLRERVHDPYRAGEKLRQKIRCPDCGVTYRNGRWVWPETESRGLMQQLCPACRRIDDRYPAGELVIAGDFIEAHEDEILATIRHVAEAEVSEHPLNRIMAIDEDDGVLVISTTDLHLPHRIAHALRDAWGGTMKTHYDLGGCFTRVLWERDT
jgi:NMD protein affecting ribosome stability and mRNA decay